MIDKAKVAEIGSNSDSARSPGKVVLADGKQLTVATGEGELSLSAIAPAGKKHMKVDEFLRGYRVREGDILGPLQPA